VVDKVHFETLHLKKLDTLKFRVTKERLDFIRKCSLYIMYSYSLIIFCTWTRVVHYNVSHIYYQTFFGIKQSKEMIAVLGLI
jgi:hypothetical protein